MRFPVSDSPEVEATPTGPPQSLDQRTHTRAFAVGCWCQVLSGSRARGELVRHQTGKQDAEIRFPRTRAMRAPARCLHGWVRNDAQKIRT